jgi:hypothetical protein
MPKPKRSFRFSDKTMAQLDKGVKILKKKMPYMDRTKFLEYIINAFVTKKR